LPRARRHGRDLVILTALSSASTQTGQPGIDNLGDPLCSDRTLNENAVLI
jgi:hypothetical protein